GHSRISARAVRRPPAGRRRQGGGTARSARGAPGPECRGGCPLPARPRHRRQAASALPQRNGKVRPALPAVPAREQSLPGGRGHRGASHPLGNSEGGSAPLPKPPPEKIALAKPALEAELFARERVRNRSERRR